MSAEDAASEGPAASTVEEQLAAVKGVDIAATMSFMTDKFLRPADYTKIHQTLSKDWDRLQSLTAALKLMEKYGVAVSKEEEDRLASMDEERQIEALVLKMPQQSKDEFHQFFLQLQVLVATATKVRQALEQGRPDEVEGVLDATDPGIKPYVLRMAIVQAGSEADSASRQLRSWGKDRAAVMGRNIRGQEEAVNVNKKLQEARRQLNVFTSSQNEKSKKVVMNFLNNSAAGLKAASFKGWHGAIKQERLEREVGGEYVDKIAKTRAKIIELKARKLENVRKSIGRQAAADGADLLQEVFVIWQKETFDLKYAIELDCQKKHLDDRIKAAKSQQKAKAAAAMSRMTGNADVGLKSLTFNAWVAFHVDCQKEKELEGEVKAAEARIQEHIKAKGESAKKLLSATIGSTDSGLMHQMFQAWLEALREAKEEARVAEALQGAENKFKAFGAKGKTAGMSAAERVTYYNDMSLVIKTWSAWKLDTRMEKQLRFYHGRIDAKRKQLLGVQEMFRSFANELEGGLKKASAESTRGDAPAALKGRGLAKSDSSVNLPDIHNKKTQVARDHGLSYNPQERRGADRPRAGKAVVAGSGAYPGH
mmetsp:Transcript_117630/g.315404  ORF Transcript_117630/g.315404 Transcript_117630/m.315404 type:complete len:594 (-) Transcript_117630:42-1823(-)